MPTSSEVIVALAIAVGGGVSAYVDIKTRRVPNPLTMGIAALGVTLAVAGVSGVGTANALLGFAVGLLFMLPGFLIGATGGGDVKLFAALGTMLNASTIPDGVASVGAGVTIPQGRIVHAVAEAAILLIMMSIGTGSYEVWGVPYDYVNGRNTTEAYDALAAAGEDKVKTVETDFVMNEAHAQAIAAREFLFAALSANSFGLTMVDDLRVQVGDILELPDETRLFVTGFDRNLSHGAPATLQVQGFQIPAVAGA